MTQLVSAPVSSQTAGCGCKDRETPGVREHLIGWGAREFGHAHSRSLFSHLIGTRAILGRWLQPRWLQDAGAVHSIYSTDSYRKQLLPFSRRGEVQAVVGERAERLAYLFCAVPRKSFWERMDSRAHFPEEGAPMPSAADESGFELVTRNEAYLLMLLHMANLAEQARGPDGGPGRWLSRVSEIGSKLDDTEVLAPPIFGSCRQTVAQEDEDRARERYLAGLAEPDPRKAMQHFAEASLACPWLAEPRAVCAYAALRLDHLAEARHWIAGAENTLIDFGVAWDPRLSYCDWRKAIAAFDALAQGRMRADAPLPPLDLSRAPEFLPALQHATAEVHQSVPAPPAREVGLARFHQFLDSLSPRNNLRKTRIYPGLSATPWHDPSAFPLVHDLIAHFPEIRREIIRTGGQGFHREAERIPREGSWDVYMLFERGRKKVEHCTQCPVTTKVIESHRTVRSHAGLIYFSRLKPGTHIAVHRGPTNMRLRCHLGLQVPDGDCALRVGGETRGWKEGDCIVFDDHFEHEAWNHADRDRIVLIVDLWHPDLSDEEVERLEGLHWYAAEVAQSLSKYWAANSRAAKGYD